MRGFHIHFSLVNALRDGRKVTDRKVRYPYYLAQPRQASIGERLYVKEAFLIHRCDPVNNPRDCILVYRANGKRCPFCDRWVKYVSPKHMPERYSRFIIEILGVYPQDLQDITWEETVEEGMSLNEYGVWTSGYHRNVSKLPLGAREPLEAYSVTWDFMHEPHGPFWCDTKTAVWVFRFKLIETRTPIFDPDQIENLEEFFKPKGQGKQPVELKFK